MTRSKAPRPRTERDASSPSIAVSTSWPACSSASRTTLRIAASSSATRIAAHAAAFGRAISKSVPPPGRLGEPDACRRSSRRDSSRSRARDRCRERRRPPEAGRTGRSTRSRSAWRDARAVVGDAQEDGLVVRRDGDRISRARRASSARRSRGRGRAPPVSWLGSTSTRERPAADVDEERVARRARRRIARRRLDDLRAGDDLSRRGRATPESSRTTSISSSIRRVSAFIWSRARRAARRSPPRRPSFRRRARAAATGVFKSCASAARSVDFICSLVLVSSAARASAHEPLALEGETEQHRATLRHALARADAPRDEHAGPLDADGNRADRCPFRRGPTETRRSCPGGTRARRGRARTRSRRSRRPRQPALVRRASQSETLLGLQGVAQPVDGHSEKRLARRVREEGLREPRHVREVPALGFDQPQPLAGERREAADEQARDEEDEKRGDVSRIFDRERVEGRMKKKLNPAVARIAARTPGPLCQIHAERKTARRSRRATDRLR